VSPLDIMFSDYTVLQPDVLFFEASRQHLIDPDKVICYAPDVAVEELSGSTSDRDRGRKMEIYRQYGVKEYWLVDPVNRSIERYELISDGYTLAQAASVRDTLGSRVLPGLQAPLLSLFD
jgi:Uma2 family endonuclease